MNRKELCVDRKEEYMEGRSESYTCNLTAAGPDILQGLSFKDLENSPVTENLKNLWRKTANAQILKNVKA